MYIVSFASVIHIIPLDDRGGEWGDEEPPHNDKLLEKTCGDGSLPNVKKGDTKKEKGDDIEERNKDTNKGKEIASKIEQQSATGEVNPMGDPTGGKSKTSFPFNS
ncbi:hypothetical protein SUGI_0191790 [Cryptomeria japonica]|nr:hypothetical protein SUGI_0191790 [Cryptomeria japonica]